MSISDNTVRVTLVWLGICVLVYLVTAICTQSISWYHYMPNTPLMKIRIVLFFVITPLVAWTIGAKVKS